MEGCSFWSVFPGIDDRRSSHQQEGLKVNCISRQGQNKCQRLVASRHLPAACLLQFLVKYLPGTCKQAAFLYVETVHEGVAFGSE